MHVFDFWFSVSESWNITDQLAFLQWQERNIEKLLSLSYQEVNKFPIWILSFPEYTLSP